MNKQTTLSYCLCLLSLLAGGCSKDQVSLGHDDKPITGDDRDGSTGDGDKPVGDGDKAAGDGDKSSGDGDTSGGDGDTQPCTGQACGSACLPCTSADPKCGQSDVKYACNDVGACVMAGPDLCPVKDAGTLPGGDEGCSGKACGDSCTSGPTEVTTACNLSGQCVAKTEGMCAVCKDPELQFEPGCDPPTEVALLSSSGCYQPCDDKPCADPNLYCVQVWAHETCVPGSASCALDSCGGLLKLCMPD